MQRGGMWWADIPGDTRRPVLILTRQRFIERLHAILVALSCRLSVRSRPKSPSDRPTAWPDSVRSTSTTRSPCASTAVSSGSRSLSTERMDEVCLAFRFAAGC